jgi:hypothetical protein
MEGMSALLYHRDGPCANPVPGGMMNQAETIGVDDVRIARLDELG